MTSVDLDRNQITGRVMVAGDRLTDAKQGFGPNGQPVVDFRMDSVGRMDLMHRHQSRAGQYRRDSACAILGNGGTVVGRAESDVQPGKDAGRDPALAAEEAVRDAVEGAGFERDDRHTSLRHPSESWIHLLSGSLTQRERWTPDFAGVTTIQSI